MIHTDTFELYSILPLLFFILTCQYYFYIHSECNTCYFISASMQDYT